MQQHSDVPIVTQPQPAGVSLVHNPESTANRLDEDPECECAAEASMVHQPEPVESTAVKVDISPTTSPVRIPHSRTAASDIGLTGIESPGRFRTSLWDCCKKWGTCLVTCLAPCYTAGVVARGVNLSCCLCCCCSLLPVFGQYSRTFVRGKIRKRRAIKGSHCEDCLLHTFCCCCALIQEHTEVMYNHRTHLNRLKGVHLDDTDLDYIFGGCLVADPHCGDGACLCLHTASCCDGDCCNGHSGCCCCDRHCLFVLRHHGCDCCDCDGDGDCDCGDCAHVLCCCCDD